jgi:hypothetical protein
MMGEHDDQPTAEMTSARRQWHLGSGVIVGGAIAAVLIAAGMTYRATNLTGQVDVAKEQVATEKDRKQEYVDRALALCDPKDEVALQKLRSVGLCALAEEDKEQAAPPAPEVSFGQVLSAVEAYLRANPPKDGRTPTRDELLALTEQVYRAAPPAPGKTPTREELLALIREVYSADPPADGKDGADGADGKDGPQGPGVASVDLVPRDDRCFLVVTFEKYLDGRQTAPTEREVDPRLCYTPPTTSASVVPTS